MNPADLSLEGGEEKKLRKVQEIKKQTEAWVTDSKSKEKS